MTINLYYINNLLKEYLAVVSTCRFQRNLILEAAVNPQHISIQRSAARSEEATYNSTPTAPSRRPLLIRRQTATTEAAALRGVITVTSASSELIGNTDGLDSRSSSSPPHISVQRSAARSEEATHNSTSTASSRHPLPVRRQTVYICRDGVDVVYVSFEQHLADLLTSRRFRNTCFVPGTRNKKKWAGRRRKEGKGGVWVQDYFFRPPLPW